jgi:hypothetical protein
MKTIKNRLGPPYRRYDFTLDYLEGPKEDEQLLGALRRYTDGVIVFDGGKELTFKVVLSGSMYFAYTFDHNEFGPDVTHKNKDSHVHYTSFYKKDFKEKMLDNPEFRPFIDAALEKAFIREYGGDHAEGEGPDFDSEMERRLAESDLEESTDLLNG